MSGLQRFLVACALSATVAVVGCDGSPPVILLSIYARDAAVEQLQVSVVDRTGQNPRLDAPPRRFVPARRPRCREADSEACEADGYLRVAVELTPGASEVLVHVRGITPDGRTLVATRCYDASASSVTSDSLVLVELPAALDMDHDSFIDATQNPLGACLQYEPNAESPDGYGERTCIRPGPDAEGDHVCPEGVGLDCDDADADIFPGAGIVCRNDVDEDCDGIVEEACADSDGDGFEACPEEPTEPCDCNDNVASIHPDAEDLCRDGIDQDCDGMDACCDEDGDGIGQCAGLAPDCADTDAQCGGMTGCAAAIFPGAEEICDGLDNNCNGAVDELEECRGPDLDGDGVKACGHRDLQAGEPCDCNDCDPAIAEGARELCRNMVDEDCDGIVDEGCLPEDTDGDGVAPPRDCDDSDPLTYPQVGSDFVERCGDGIPQNCVPGDPDGVCDEESDPDGDGYIEPDRCESNPASHPGITPAADEPRAESCNTFVDDQGVERALDDDCDGVANEVLSAPAEGFPQGHYGCGTTPGGGVAGAIDLRTDFAHCGTCRNICPLGRADLCRDGQCACAAETEPGPCAEGMLCCGNPSGGCVDTSTDPNHCGGCNRQCGPGEACAGGQCVCGSASGMGGVGGAACGSGTVCCGETGARDGECVSLLTDNRHCGACGFSCGPNTACSAASCGCQTDWGDCDGLGLGPGSNGCETPTDTTPAHCGGCGQACDLAHTATHRCVGSVCQIETCEADWDDCDTQHPNGCESSLRTLAHCDGCEQPCELANASETCATRSCEVDACQAGFADCDGAASNGCERPTTTVTDCGGCGVACNLPHAVEACDRGTCVVASCEAGWADCNTRDDDGCEVELATTDAHCGACNNACGANAACQDGSCACNAGQLDCALGSPYCEVTFSTSNCGDCDVTCADGETCTADGRCQCNSAAPGGIGAGSTCLPGQDCCADSGCTNIDTETDCGGCDIACGADESCGGTNGDTCVCGSDSGSPRGGAACSAPRICCPGNRCINTNINENNCGACGNACGGTSPLCCGGDCFDGATDEQHCGDCATSCSAGQTCCGGGCADLSTDEQHCGDCATSCTAGQTCCGGSCSDLDDAANCTACGVSCAANEDCCTDGCTAVDTVESCGGCGLACATNETCEPSGGSWACSCEGGRACTGTEECCPGVGCVDTQSDGSHCGMCGNRCTGALLCIDGSCVAGGG